MNTTNNLTPEVFQKYLESKRLGILHIDIPDCDLSKRFAETLPLNIFLEYLFKEATGFKFFEQKTKPENIEAICVYGSVLYKHFPRKTGVRKRKKWFLGKEIQEEVLLPRKKPNDLDVMVITKEGFTEEKVIIPSEQVKTGVISNVQYDDGYGYYEVRNNHNLHITYRSMAQFLSGIGNGDTLSESVFRYGVPIVGSERFEELTDTSYDRIKRAPQHEIEWHENTEGILWGKIIEKTLTEQNKKDETKITGPINELVGF
ncbi:hypothetical protein HZA97_05420 [Candidatus Woesearchaeota archaeon]|nr:hypothetical protein [Candidatus Woesearchaeota archaeon]